MAGLSCLNRKIRFDEILIFMCSLVSQLLFNLPCFTVIHHTFTDLLKDIVVHAQHDFFCEELLFLIQY